MPRPGRRPLAAARPLSTVGSLKPAPPPGPLGPEGVPIPRAPELAPAGYLNPGQTLDGINCGPVEMLNYHIHAHLTVFVEAPRD